MVNRKIKHFICKIMTGVFASAACVLLLSNLPLARTEVNADSEIEINEVNFPDDRFREIVSHFIDYDKDGFLSNEEISILESFSTASSGIRDLKGIEYFTALEVLDCSYSNITSLDVSMNTNLEKLICNNNQLTSLDVRKNTRLESLSCYNNPLKVLNITNNSKLLNSYAAGENTADRWKDLPDSAIYYRKSNYAGISVDRSAVIIASPFEPGWNEIEGLWFYAKDKDAVTGWEKIDAGWYYFDSAGMMLTDWQEIDGTWYYFNPTGSMVTGWKQISGNWYYFGESGSLRKSWQNIGGSWYYFSDSGAMVTGWQKIGEVWYYFESSGAMVTGWKEISGVYYFFKSNGAMASNEYCGGYWLDASGAWTYKYKASWKHDAKGWWYGDDSGWYAKNRTLKIDGKDYNFNASGYCTNP